MQDEVQRLCSDAQDQLTETDYIAAERLLMQAEDLSWEQRNYDAISRLYMPLQEARRQRRQRAGEGVVKLDIIAYDEETAIDVDQIIQQTPHGQILVAGWGSIEQAKRVRQIASDQKLYLDCFLAAAYLIGQTSSIVVVIVPKDTVAMPLPGTYSIDRLLSLVPLHSIVLPCNELPKGEKKGDTGTFGFTMSLWEKLHAPFLAMADHTTDDYQKIMGYRDTIRVDYACEFAHQRLSHVAQSLLRK